MSHTTQAVSQNPTMIISTKQTSAALGEKWVWLATTQLLSLADIVPLQEKESD